MSRARALSLLLGGGDSSLLKEDGLSSETLNELENFLRPKKVDVREGLRQRSKSEAALLLDSASQSKRPRREGANQNRYRSVCMKPPLPSNNVKRRRVQSADVRKRADSRYLDIERGEIKSYLGAPKFCLTRDPLERPMTAMAGGNNGRGGLVTIDKKSLVTTVKGNPSEKKATVSGVGFDANSPGSPDGLVNSGPATADRGRRVRGKRRPLSAHPGKKQLESFMAAQQRDMAEGRDIQIHINLSHLLPNSGGNPPGIGTAGLLSEAGKKRPMSAVLNSSNGKKVSLPGTEGYYLFKDI